LESELVELRGAELVKELRFFFVFIVLPLSTLVGEMLFGGSWKGYEKVGRVAKKLEKL